LSEPPEDDEHPSPKDEDEIPRQGLLSAMPKRTFSRVVLLLAMLAGIIYLRQRTASIAGCMASAFSLPIPAQPTTTPSQIKARVILPSEPPKASP
jgi:hypothetical protein